MKAARRLVAALLSGILIAAAPGHASYAAAAAALRTAPRIIPPAAGIAPVGLPDLTVQSGLASNKFDLHSLPKGAAVPGLAQPPRLAAPAAPQAALLPESGVLAPETAKPESRTSLELLKETAQPTQAANPDAPEAAALHGRRSFDGQNEASEHSPGLPFWAEVGSGFLRPLAAASANKAMTAAPAVPAPSSWLRAAREGLPVLPALGLAGLAGLTLYLSGFSLVHLAYLGTLAVGAVCYRVSNTLEEAEAARMALDEKTRREGMLEAQRILRAFGAAAGKENDNPEAKTRVNGELVTRSA
ncbi:MAG: hypothetical protein PHF00_13375, partial [Elusimicrobia bacterium]|nr:hypothetical protein [Elusimicrobiota bacterium]